ncbi:hypothetical protein BKA64DRAFT_684484 [Cadophora sp. MPI-SDFR-AT-0126]|nr:hypothetical protein BKA64DRAFT_684484 [Leotiomycetes sp. MPI-SDFR-AT-0126]
MNLTIVLLLHLSNPLITTAQQHLSAVIIVIIISLLLHSNSLLPPTRTSHNFLLRTFKSLNNVHINSEIIIVFILNLDVI